MKLLTSLAGGLAGALAVTLLHELTRKMGTSNAPRLDTLGEQATAKLIEKTGHDAPTGSKLHNTALAGDILANTLYYSLAGARMNKAMSTGGILGLSAGIGALKLPGVLGLSEDKTNSSPKQRWLTIGLYVAGGLIAAGVTRWLEKKAKRNNTGGPAYSPEKSYKPVLDITA
ncbi:hypothetical protein [Paraflavitalea pollutisoli]|uniref:hypothetical protein n=1 Tax=Paraflavitalea pollutisoli TaxID=3034143 RepID=UPI0023ED7590|nr:hypothetical protein [Paraflavitalea sp. H1-2-19X]